MKRKRDRATLCIFCASAGCRYCQDEPTPPRSKAKPAVAPFVAPTPASAPAPAPIGTKREGRAEGRRRRDHAVQQVGDHASDAFMDQAMLAIDTAARSRETFTVDDVWLVFSNWPYTRDRRAMGAAIRLAKTRRVIEPTERFVPTAQAQCHASPRRIWRSLLIAPLQTAS